MLNNDIPLFDSTKAHPAQRPLKPVGHAADNNLAAVEGPLLAISHVTPVILGELSAARKSSLGPGPTPFTSRIGPDKSGYRKVALPGTGLAEVPVAFGVRAFLLGRQTVSFGQAFYQDVAGAVGFIFLGK